VKRRYPVFFVRAPKIFVSLQIKKIKRTKTKGQRQKNKDKRTKIISFFNVFNKVFARYSLLFALKIYSLWLRKYFTALVIMHA